MMSTKSKRELVTTLSPRYVTATGADKRRILDEFVAITGFHRKYAIVLLRHPPVPRRQSITRARAKTYTPTKPGSLLKHQIPIRTFADWDDAQPGFLEIDLVGHGGESTSGDGRPLGSMHSLVLTDIAT